MSQVIAVHDMAATGVKLLRHGDPSFASALSPDRSPSVDALLPYAVLISNETDQNILAYSIRWKCTAPDGKVIIQESTIFNQATLRVLESRSRHLVSSAPGIGSWSHNEPQAQAEETQTINSLLTFYRNQQSIDISLEAVIFSDGRTVGSDTGSWVPRIKAWVDAERDLVQQVQAVTIRDLQKTLVQTRDEALAALTTPELKQIGLALAANRSPSYVQAHRFAKGKFAAQMLDSIERNGASAALDFARDLSARKTWPNIRRDDIGEK